MHVTGLLRTGLFAAFAARTSATVVVAHYMAGEAYELNAGDWSNDILTARSLGIQGFALNIAADGSLGTIIERTDEAWSVAEGLGSGFKLFWSFDLDYTWTADQITDLIGRHSNSPATYQWGGKQLVSTFGGWFGDQVYPDSFWSGVKSTMAARGIPIILSPSFITYRDPSTASTLASKFPSIDGFFNWPTYGMAALMDSDTAFRNALRGRAGPYIMAVSPWQFKDLGASQPDQNWVENSDGLWVARWTQVINFQPDIVEIISWNDYGESHYINAINPKVGLGGPDGAPNYVPGFDHTGWQIVAKYFIDIIHTGTSTVTNDVVIYYYRTHPAAVTCSGGVVPRNSGVQTDQIMAIPILLSAANITISIGGSTRQSPVGSGLSPPSYLGFSSANNGQSPTFQITRGGRVVGSATGPIPITNACPYYNFNAIVGVLKV